MEYGSNGSPRNENEISSQRLTKYNSIRQYHFDILLTQFYEYMLFDFYLLPKNTAEKRTYKNLHNLPLEKSKQ